MSQCDTCDPDVQNHAQATGIPYHDRWHARPQYWRQYNSVLHGGPQWHGGQTPYYSKNLVDNYMSYLSLDPTKYKSFGVSPYSYADTSPKKNYGTCSCEKSQGGINVNKCAPGYEPVCSWQGNGNQCTCAKSGSCGRCDFGQGSMSGVWSGGGQGY